MIIADTEPTQSMKGRSSWVSSGGRVVPSIHVIIVNYRTAALVKPLVSDLPAHVAVTVVNNGPEEEAAMLAAIVGRAAIVESETNVGFAAGVNTGLRMVAQGSWVLLLNPDAYFPGEAIDALVQEAQDRQLDVLSPRVVWSGTDRTWFDGGFLDRRRGIVDDSRDRNDDECPFISGCVMLLSPKAIASVTPLREEYFMYWEDADLCLRAWAQGLRLGVATTMPASHDDGRSSLKDKDVAHSGLYYYYMARNRLWAIREHRSYFSRIALAYTPLYAAKVLREIVSGGRGRGGKVLATSAGVLMGAFARRRTSYLAQWNPWRA